MLEHALELQKKGFYIFPLLPGQKIVKKDFHWKEEATRDEEQIKKWWTETPNANIGIAGKRFLDDKYLVIIDVDNSLKKDGTKKQGNKTMRELKAQGKKIPETLVQATARGGFHIVYWSDTPVKQGSNVLGPDVDIRAAGGYIVGSGSTFAGKKYELKKDIEVAKCPQWILDACGKEIEKEPVQDQKAIAQANRAEHISRAIEYLKRTDGAVEGSGGDQRTFKVAARLKDFGLTSDMCLELMWNIWNEKCTPEWDYDDLRAKVENAYRHGKKAIGSETPEAVFDVVEDYKKEDWYERINQEYALKCHGKVVTIFRETYDSEGNFKVYDYTKDGFKTVFANKPKIAVKNANMKKPKFFNQAELWLEHPNRREVAGVTFDPSGGPLVDGKINLWRGFKYKAKPPEQCSPQAKEALDLFVKHIEENVAGKYADWFLGFMAHIIQKPGEKVRTAVVMRGKKGVGKNIAVEIFGHLLGKNFSVIGESSRLKQNFNGQFEGKLAVVLDEAVHSGDKALDAKMKAFITSEDFLVEKKFQEPYFVKNRLRTFILSNDYRVVETTAGERRWAVFEVGDGWKGQLSRFDKMHRGLTTGDGPSLLMHYFENFDLSKVDLGTIPNTQGLREQIDYNLNPVEQWWADCLEEGTIGGQGLDESWPEFVRLKDVVSTVKFAIKQDGRKNFDWNQQTIAKEFKTFSEGIQKKTARVEGRPQKVWSIPPLEQARKDWDKRLNFKHDWAITEN